MPTLPNRWFIRSVFLVAGAASSALAQQTAPEHQPGISVASRSLSSDGLLFAIVGGPGRATATPFHTTKRPMVFEVDVEKTLKSVGTSHLRFDYFVGSQPAISLAGNLRYTWTRYCESPRCRMPYDDVTQRHYTAYGLGITPLGLRGTVLLPSRVRLSVSFAAGGVYLTRPVPYPQATHLNFRFSARPAVGVPLGSVGTLWGGYELFHISNGDLGKVNPGINAGLVMLGFQRAR